MRLRDELSALRQHEETRWRRVGRLLVSLLLGLLLLGGGGWWVYDRLSEQIAASGTVTESRLREHLRQSIDESYRAAWSSADEAANWQERERLREAAETARSNRRARLDDLVASFVEMESGSETNRTFQEMTLILEEQGVDEAIAYVATRQPAILTQVRARAAAAQARNRVDLQTLLQTASLYDNRDQPDKARKLYTDILALEPDWPEALERFFWFLIDEGDVVRVRATLAEAAREYRQAYDIAWCLAAADPDNARWQRDLSLAHGKIGDVKFWQGDLSAALASYQDSLAIAKHLAAADPTNAGWQRDLSVSHGRIGDVQVRQGDLGAALASYQDSLAIAKHLAAADPDNARWQRDLSVAYERVGDLQEALGDIAAAIAAYEQSLHIAQSLTERFPRYSQFQSDVRITKQRLEELRSQME